MAVESERKCIFPALPQTERGRFIVLGEDTRAVKSTFLYCCGNNVYIRDINRPDECDVFCEHSKQALVAKYNKTGFYIASGDINGKIKIWDTVNKEHLVKTEIDGLASRINDISWSPDTELRMTSIAFGGHGADKYARVVTADTGNNKGEITKQTKAVNNIAYRPVRPFRIVTASEDMCIHFFKGPPFKYDQEIVEHKNFVNCVRYSPTGDCFISGGADGQAIIFDGESAEILGALVDSKVPTPKGVPQAHSGGIYSVSFSEDGKEFLTVSGDKTAKLWNVEKRELLGEFNIGKDIKDMQVGCLWQGDNIMSVSLSGFISFLDRNNPSNGKGIHTPVKILKGHNKPINSMAVSPDFTKLFTGSGEIVNNSKAALILCWDLTSSTAEDIQGKGHESVVTDMTVVGNNLVSVSMDDTLRFTDVSTNMPAYNNKVCKLPSQPKGVAGIEGSTIVACQDHIVVVDDDCQIVYVVQVKFVPTCVSVTNGSQVLVAVGGQADGNVHIFSLAQNSLTGLRKIEITDDVVDVKFSPDGSQLAVGTGSKKNIKLYDVNNDYAVVFSETKQTAKILSIDWCPNGSYFASGSLDCTVVIWGNKKGKSSTSYVHFMKGEHGKGQVKKVRWLSDSVLATCTDEGNIRQFQFKNLQGQT